MNDHLGVVEGVHREQDALSWQWDVWGLFGTRGEAHPSSKKNLIPFLWFKLIQYVPGSRLSALHILSYSNLLTILLDTYDLKKIDSLLKVAKKLH